MSDPSQDRPYLYGSALVAAAPTDPIVQDSSQETVTEPQPTVIVAVEEAPLVGEILPPESPVTLAPETPPSIPQYPIGLIDYNQPIVVLDGDEYHTDPDVYDNPVIVTVLKGSVHPVAISFWKHGEQCLAQFDTDGQSACGDYKVEQDLIYPVTRWVVIGRDGRNLTVDEELYPSEDAARTETDLDIAGVFPVVIEAPKVEEPVPAPQLDEALDALNGESEEQEGEEAPQPPSLDAPAEMYVAGRNRRVGESVYAYRNNFGVRLCTILKLRRDSRKSLLLDPKDGNEPYWALNKNVRP